MRCAVLIAAMLLLAACSGVQSDDKVEPFQPRRITVNDLIGDLPKFKEHLACRDVKANPPRVLVDRYYDDRRKEGGRFRFAEIITVPEMDFVMVNYALDGKNSFFVIIRGMLLEVQRGEIAKLFSRYVPHEYLFSDFRHLRFYSEFFTCIYV